MTMTPVEQGKLYKAIRLRCPGWSQKKHSGYVHGAVDGSRRSEPRQVYVRGFRKEKDYDVGYIYGFIDAFYGMFPGPYFSNSFFFRHRALLYKSLFLFPSVDSV